VTVIGEPFPPAETSPVDPLISIDLTDEEIWSSSPVPISAGVRATGSPSGPVNVMVLSAAPVEESMTVPVPMPVPVSATGGE